jgi:hypothetical protein
MARTTLTPVNFPGTAGAAFATAGAVALTSFTGVQFALAGNMILYVSVGSSGAGNVTQKIGRKVQGIAPIEPDVAVADSTNYWFGPWSPTDFTQQDGSGMMFIDFSVVTGNAVTLYQLVPLL